MKWPKELVFVRHAQSEYNVLRAKKEKSELYQQFVSAFEKDPDSVNSKFLAESIDMEFGLSMSDRETPLTQEGARHASVTGICLANPTGGKGPQGVPDVIIVSPYTRTLDTLYHISREWPELRDVPRFEEERIRELDHGLALNYNDWRVFETMHPDQRRLRNLLGPYDYRFPNGENIPDVRLRIQSWLGTLIREFADKRVLVITHHLTILAMRATLERLGPKQFQALDEKQKPVNCGVTIYRGDSSLGKNGKLELVEYNTKYY